MNKKIKLCLFLLMLCTICACASQRTEPQLNERGKEEIRLCVGSYNDWLEGAVANYNKQSSRYEIVVRWCEEEEKLEEYRKQIKQELISGAGPDIISNDVLEDRNKKPYAEAGVFMDMTEFFENQENLCDKAVEFNRVNSKLYGVPISFTLNTMVTSKKLGIDSKTWTMDKCMQVMKESGGKVFCKESDVDSGEETGMYVLQCMGMEGVEQFTDSTRGISAFMQPEFVELLEFAKGYADSNPKGEKDFAFGMGTINNMKGFLFWEELFGETVSYIGYPSPDGGIFKMDVDSFYVNQSTYHKEGVSDFLNFLLSEKQQKQLIVGEDSHFPVRMDVLDNMWSEAKEEEKAFWQMLEQSVYVTHQNDIEEIVREEAMSFFTGAKTAKEVAMIIDTRVQLYLDRIG